MRAQVLAHLALDLPRVGNHLVQAAVLHNERGRLLGANARHAGNVVRGVALQTIEVRHQLGRDAVVQVVHGLRRHNADVAHALLGGNDLHVVRGQLVHVPVASEEQHLVASLLAAASQGAQDVVALPALALAHRHVQRAQQVLDHGKLLVQGRVHGRALGLVLGQHLHADGGLALVEGADDAVRLEGLVQLDEHVEEAEERVGGATVRRVHGLADGVEGAVHEGVAVYDRDDPALRGCFRCRGGFVLAGI